MSLSLLATTFNQDLTISGVFPVLGYTLMFDAISNETSTVTLKNDIKVKDGDYIALKEINENFVLYYGQITAVETDSDSGIATLSTNFIWNDLNGDVLVTNKSGVSYEKHLKSMISKYSDVSAGIFKDVTVLTNTPYEVTTSEGIKSINFIDYIIRGFKLHNTVISASNIGHGVLPNGNTYYYPLIEIKQVSRTVSFSDNISSFKNWNVTDSRLLRGYSNELWIVDKATTDMENPVVLGKYWLQNDGKVVNAINKLVIRPTQKSIYLYDKTATDNPTNDEIGRANLGGNNYYHNINFSIGINNNFLNIRDVELGLQSNIYYQGRVYKSILTGYELSSDSDDIKLIFGNLRFGKKDLVDSEL